MTRPGCRIVGTLALAALAALARPGAGAAPADTPAKPAVLFAGSDGGWCGHDVAKRLARAGFALQGMGHPGLSGRALSRDQARQYNVIVLSGLGRANADMSLGRTKQTVDVLNRFLAAGGGVLVLGTYGQMATDAPPQRAFLEPLGLKCLFDEMVRDGATSVTATAWRLPFAHTAAVADSPLTAGVKGLWYPVPASRHGGQNHTVSFVADGSWQVLIRGGRSSYTTRAGGPGTARGAGAGTHARDVPLVACRTVGKGRIVFLAVTAAYVTGGAATTTLEGIFLDRGLTGRPSGGYRLFANALRWLAAPSAGTGALGGAKMHAGMLAEPHKTRFGRPFDWSRDVPFPAVEPAHAGVIGARSRYSTGKATVEQWAARAKACKLAFVVFLEDFRELSADEFDRLKADCARVSSPAFAAIPGFAIDDEVGNHYFYFGTTFGYPDGKFLSPDGRVFRACDAGLGRKSPYVPGQLAMTTLDYAYSISSFKLTAGNYLFGRDAAPFADFFSNWDAAGVMTARNGKLLEDATGEYLKMVDSGQGPLPLAVELLDDPAPLATIRRRTVLRLPPGGGQLIGGRVEADTRIRDYFNAWHFYPDNPCKITLTSGPEIESWAYVGPRDYEGNTRGDFVWQNYRWRLRAKVRAEAGLKEVAVHDGTALFRRFLPGGKTEFAFTLDLTHDRQHNLVLVVTDRAGGKAVSGEHWDRNHRLEEFMCSDRNNQLSYGYVTNRRGIGLLLGGNQTLATPNKRLAPGLSPSGTFRNDGLLGAPAFDGAAGGDPQVWEQVAPISPAAAAAAPNVNEARRLLHTRDVHVGEGLRRHVFADGIEIHNVWHTLWRTVPADAYTVTRRNHFFQIDPDRPLAAFLWEIDFRLLRDLPNKGFRVATMAPGSSRLWALRSSDGQACCGAWEPARLSRPRTHHVPFGKGAYAAFLDSPLGGAAVFSLTDGLTARLALPARGGVEIALPADRAPQKKHEARRIRLLLLGIPRITPHTQELPGASNEVVERFRRDFALGGGPGGCEVQCAAGRVVGRRFLLHVDGAEARCFAGTLTGELVSSLPITVSGLNDRWSSFLYDRKLKKARPVGTFAGKAWATVVVRGRRELFIGQPVTADRPELFVQLTQSGPDAWQLEVHNPTDRAIRTTVRKNPHFDPLRARPFTSETLTLPAGSSVHRKL